MVERQRKDVKSHPDHVPNGVIERIFPEAGYGFVRTSNGREVYFHRNSVVNGRFEDLSVGAGVRFVEEEGDKGPQASTLQLMQPPEAQTAERE